MQRSPSTFHYSLTACRNSNLMMQASRQESEEQIVPCDDIEDLEDIQEIMIFQNDRQSYSAKTHDVLRQSRDSLDESKDDNNKLNDAHNVYPFTYEEKVLLNGSQDFRSATSSPCGSDVSCSTDDPLGDIMECIETVDKVQGCKADSTGGNKTILKCFPRYYSIIFLTLLHICTFS